MSIDFDAEIERHLPFVQKPSRYIGGELNRITKPAGDVDLTVALAFPEVYEIGMSHLGIKILYHVINARPDALADRVFTPWVDMESRMRRSGLPLWGLETRLPLCDFDIIGFSIMHELMYTNILTMLDLGKVPLKGRDRAAEDPIVIGGGPCVSNPEPLVPFFDAFVIGEGEGAVCDILDCVKEARRDRSSRDEALYRLAHIDGVYVPVLYRPDYSNRGDFIGTIPTKPDLPQRIQKRFPPRLSPSFYPDAPLVPSTRIVQDRLDVELFRGCTRGCRFCHAGYFYRPVREREVTEVERHLRQGLRQSGWDEFGLLSLSSSDYSCLEPLLDRLKGELIERRISCSLPSLRADNFSLALSETLSSIKRTGLTFAPEAGTERLGRVINKAIDRKNMLETARVAYGSGWKLIKCYFMIGLPTETEEDIDGIIELTNDISRISREAGPGNRLNISVGAFVPKPHTPFQWEAFCPRDILMKRLRRIQHCVKSRHIKVKWHSIDASRLEAMLARGDRGMSRAIEIAWSLGSRFDEWTELCSPSTWEKAVQRAGIDPNSGLRARDEDKPLPWDHIDLRIHKAFLRRERARAMDAQITEDCRWNRCNGCGIPGPPGDIVLSKGVVPSDRPPSVSPSHETRRETAVRLRVVYRKEGLTRFLSHLDTIQVFMRAFRRIELPLGYTKGKSPRPRISSGPPLPTGVVGLEEILDLYLVDDPERDVVSAINIFLPDGLAVVDAYPISPHSHAPSAILTWGDYRVEIENSSCRPQADFSSAIHSFHQRSTFPVSISRKGRTVQVDLKKSVLNPAFSHDSRSFTLSFMSRLLDNEGHCNTASPDVVLEHLFSIDLPARKTARISRNSLRTPDLSRLVRPLIP